MICRIQGELVELTENAAHIRCGNLTYEILVPACDLGSLSTLVGSDIELHTREIIESSNQGASFIPRKVGFMTPECREFFELLTKVKGIGYRKALRAMREPVWTIAGAIADRDLALLKSLPEIGGRMAETILTELKGKVDRFIESKPVSVDGTPTGKRGAISADALSVLVQLGENRSQARTLIDRAFATDPTIDTADMLVTASLRLKDLG
jgi:Holliday junction DNA helicase RuvA